MAKKKYNIENPDAIYRDSGNDISLGQFNQYYINYLNQKQEYLSKKAKMQLNFYYMENDAAVPNHRYCFLLTCPNTQELWYFADNPVTNVGTYALFKASILPALAENGYSVYGMDLGTIADASFDTTWDAWYQEFQILNNYLDVYDRVACKAGSIVFSEWALGMVNFANREFFEILENPRQPLKDILPDAYDDVLEPQQPEAMVPISEVETVTYTPAVIEPEIKGSLLFPGEWQKAEGWHVAYYNKLAYDIPDLFIISDASDLIYKKECLVCISVYWPGVPYVLVFNRRNMVQFGQKDQWTITQWDINKNVVYGVVKQVHKNLDIWQWITTSYRNDFDFLEDKLIPYFNQPRLGRNGWTIGDSRYFFNPGDVIDLSWLDDLKGKYNLLMDMVNVLKANQGYYKVSKFLTSKLEGQLHI